MLIELLVVSSLIFSAPPASAHKTGVPDCCKSHYGMTTIRLDDWSPLAIGDPDTVGAKSEVTRVR